MRRAYAYLCLVSLAAVATSASGQNLASLGETFGEEVRSLQIDLREHATTRDSENELLAELLDTYRELDRMLEDPSTSFANLRKLDARLLSLQQEFVEVGRGAAEGRTLMYARMARVDELLGEIAKAGVDIVQPGEGLTGTWRLEVPEYGVSGVMSLRQEGTLIRGSYQMSTGARGSIDGTFAGGKLEIESVDSEEGAIGPSTATLDADSGELQGAWLARDLSSGGPSRVDWTARLFTIDDLLGAP